MQAWDLVSEELRAKVNIIIEGPQKDTCGNMYFVFWNVFPVANRILYRIVDSLIC